MRFSLTTWQLCVSTLAALVSAPALHSQSTQDPAANVSPGAPSPDPRVGLRGGEYDAAEAIWNLRVVSESRPSEKFRDGINSDLAFLGNYVFQGSFSGYQVWDISNPKRPVVRTAYFCPAAQSDVSVYRNLLFVSAEDLSARIDCGAEGVKDTVSKDRLRGIRIFDISDIAHPKLVANVQTCRGSHTHSLLVDPRDPNNVYVYISGIGPVRSPNELAGCLELAPGRDPNSALLRIEVVRVPLAHPEQAGIVSTPRVFTGLNPAPRHGESDVEKAEKAEEVAAAKARGAFSSVIFGEEEVAPDEWVAAQLAAIVKERGSTAAPTAADSAELRRRLPDLVRKMLGMDPNGPRPPTLAPMDCHDITLYPAIGRGGGACGGYGLLLDISDPAHPTRLNAAADSNFSYWHSATFNNDGTKVLFSDEWGGGAQPKCRTTDPREWGADAIFTVVGTSMSFKSYYKLPAPQSRNENCVAHNGSLIPIPGRDIMVQAWYQGGISVFDWTDAAHPREIAFFDRGPADTTLKFSGSWSAYWYNGFIVSSEITRGLDILELAPSAFISQNEIDASKTVHFDYYNVQGQQKFVWPPSFALARAYVDQLERSKGLTTSQISAVRQRLASAELAAGSSRARSLKSLASQLDKEAGGSSGASKVRALAAAVRGLSGPMTHRQIEAIPLTSRVAVRQIDDEARAALAILEKEYAHQPVDSGDWHRLFSAEGYLRLKERESFMKRSFTDDDFRAFMASDTLIHRTPELRRALDGMREIDVTDAARQALTYLPVNARIVARLYPEIKPKTNTFVFSLDSVPGIFVYVDPSRTPAEFQNTLTHELHHIGLGSVCQSAPDTSIAEPLRTLLYRMGGFGEGFAMLAAAGSADSNAHYASDSATRARWDRDVASFPQNLQLLQRFFLDVVEGRVTSPDSVATLAGQFYGEQGPWYTVGWKMAVVIEKVFGRERLVSIMCDPSALLSTYNAAVPSWNAARGEHLPLWSRGLLAKLRG